MPATGTIEINGIELHHERTGSGPPLVLVHGSWTDANSWQLVAPALAEAFEVVTYDRRGHSRSERPATQGSRRQDEDDLISLIEALGVGPVHLAGSGFGGSIALGVAARRPDLVRTVIVHEPPLLSELDDAAIVAEVHAVAAAVVADLEAGAVERGTARFVEEVAAPMFVDLLGDPDWDRLDATELDVPLMVTAGDLSMPWLPAIAECLADRFHGTTFHVIAGAGHVPHLTHPDEYVEALRVFVALRYDSSALTGAGTPTIAG